MACNKLVCEGKLTRSPVLRNIAAVSVGVVGSEVLLDLDYSEDKDAEVDLNLVMTENLEFIELQASGEESVFGDEQLARMLDYGRIGIKDLVRRQEEILAAQH
jgi:ribonuclease PH